MESKRASLFITGKVQGVFFRETARREAERLGVQGWVRNLSDGRVEAVVEGPTETVDAFIQWCRQGPPTARVDGVLVAEASPTSEFSSFTVRR